MTPEAMFYKNMFTCKSFTILYIKALIYTYLLWQSFSRKHLTGNKPMWYFYKHLSVENSEKRVTAVKKGINQAFMLYGQ